MKVNRSGQATIFTQESWLRFREVVTNKTHRLIFDTAWWTGERMGAILQLEVGHVYADPAKSEPRSHITYPAGIRKDAKTRQVRIHSELAVQLWAFRPPLEGYLFQRERHPGQPLSMTDIDVLMRWYFRKLGWSDLGYSTHSFRRSFITRLHENGTDPVLIQQLTGHASLNSVMRYIEVDPKRVDRALLNL